MKILIGYVKVLARAELAADADFDIDSALPCFGVEPLTQDGMNWIVLDESIDRAPSDLADGWTLSRPIRPDLATIWHTTHRGGADYAIVVEVRHVDARCMVMAT